jgi:hypothetical protein
VLGEHAGDVVVDHHHLVGMAEELLGEDAHGGRAAAHAHALLLHPVDDGRLAGLDDHLRAAVDGELDRLLVAQRFHHFAGDAAFLLAAAGEVVHAAQRQHLRAVFDGGDVADHLAPAAHVGLLGAEPAVGVDLHLEAAVAEDALGDHGDQVDAFGLRRHDEGRRLVVGIGGGRADAGDEHALGRQQAGGRVGGIAFAGGERNQRPLPAIQGLAQQHHRIDPHQHAGGVGVAVAGAGLAGRDLAQHRAGVALDLVAGHALIRCAARHGRAPAGWAPPPASAARQSWCVLSWTIQVAWPLVPVLQFM